MHDIVIKNGTLVDGTGSSSVSGDVAVSGGRIAEVGGSITGQARREIDADGALVTPGSVDVHTHYDGQVSWDSEMAPSSRNGVTTDVMGNCGVGFAPAAPGNEQELIELMEGVEDIPGAALHEGMDWGSWETFPEYLDYIADRKYALDVGAQIDDRGTLEVGKRADINVIDHENLTVSAPVAHHDLPAGGTRLMQPVSGYLATLCNGVVTRDHDADTGQRPGRLVRS